MLRFAIYFTGLKRRIQHWGTFVALSTLISRCACVIICPTIFNGKALLLFLPWPTFVTKRKIIFLYFFTELKTCHLCYSLSILACRVTLRLWTVSMRGWLNERSFISAFSFQRWLNSLHEHCAYSTFYTTQPTVLIDDQEQDVIPLGSMQDSLKVNGVA